MNIQLSYVHMHDVPTPVLQSDLEFEQRHPELFARRSHQLKMRIAGEKRVVFELIEWLRLRSFLCVGVDDGEEYYPTNTTVEAMEHVFSVDDSTLRFEHVGTSRQHSVLIVLGNSPEEVIADWGYTEGDPDGFNAAVDQFIDQLDG